ncbi:MAG: hypothetical protein ONB05_04725 [candidate division KSB1 bacterium]|nr:hypothetical protein [candidate division KSB1 bacterium]
MINVNELAKFNDHLFMKNLVLSTEFNKYIFEHPEILDRIPNGASVVLLPADDPDFCSKMMDLVKHHRSIDDVKDRPIVYIRIQKMAPPPPSRIIDLQIEAEEMPTLI